LRGRAKKKSLATCPADWIQQLADEFRYRFSLGREVSINNPFSGGFISNAHFWHKGIPWIQIEINRALYENHDLSTGIHRWNIHELRESIWQVLTAFLKDVEIAFW
jgi:formiminoglutamase